VSHFIVIVALPTSDASLEDILAPFDENLEVAPYGTQTIEEITADKLYQSWILKVNAQRAQEGREAITQEEALKKWLGGDPEFDALGRLLSTYNPKSKWDWYEIGGRWDGYLTLKDGSTVNLAEVADLVPEAIKSPFAYTDLDGSWHEKGRMGWFGMAQDEAEQEVWDSEYLKWIQNLPEDTVLIAVDCHI